MITPERIAEIKKEAEECLVSLDGVYSKCSDQLAIIAALDAATKRAEAAEAELAVRLIVPEFEVPQYHRRNNTRPAYSDGFESAWRKRPYRNPYTSQCHIEAFTRGYNHAHDQSLMAIDAARSRSTESKGEADGK